MVPDLPPTRTIQAVFDNLEGLTAGQVIQAKAPVPGVGYFATLKDTEGNKFGLFVEDEAATMPDEVSAAATG
jgi:hypothetical protein